jgi:hypothetical protein
MRVTGPVGEGVVAAVDGDPADDLTLEAHRPRDRQHHPQRRDRGEAAMRQQAVKAHRHPEPGDHVESQREQDIGEVQAMAPGQPDRHRQPGERHDNERDRHADPSPSLDGARRSAAHSKRRPSVIIIRRKPSWHPGCSACSHGRDLPVHWSAQLHDRWRLLPVIATLAITPAPRPRTINAMTSITGSCIR